MIRYAICFAALLGGALPATAQSGKAANCELFGEITQAIAEMRKKGVKETDAILAAGETYKTLSADKLQVIPYLSSFVYSLKADDLSGDVGGAMSEQCKAA